MIMQDWGTQEHCFTGIQNYVNKRVDKFFNVTHEELYGPVRPKAESKPIFTLRRVELDRSPRSDGAQ